MFNGVLALAGLVGTEVGSSASVEGFLQPFGADWDGSRTVVGGGVENDPGNDFPVESVLSLS